LKALITGASGALGQAIACRMAKSGYEIWLHYSSNEEGARNALDQIEKAGGRGRLLGFDLTDSKAIEDVLSPVLSKDGPIQVLINNAGLSNDGYMMMMPEDQWEQVMNVNLGGFFRVTRACLKGMVQQRSGRVINIGSLAGKIGNIGQVAYAASKAGLDGATRALALEMARWNILVNTVAPGPLVAGMANEVAADKLEAMIPLGRLGELEEVAGVVAFLASDEAGYITGQVIHVNGGMGM
jgi:3-oxoacyl-[acyl-carrier protein] reductase